MPADKSETRSGAKIEDDFCGWQSRWMDVFAAMWHDLYGRASQAEADAASWVNLILKADAASDRERALATLANMARKEKAERWGKAR